jgi:hypothetical protein
MHLPVFSLSSNRTVEDKDFSECKLASTKSFVPSMFFEQDNNGHDLLLHNPALLKTSSIFSCVGIVQFIHTLGHIGA